MYKIKQYIFHESFGEGKIIDINGSGSQLKLVIDFKKTGVKTLLERIARKKLTDKNNNLINTSPKTNVQHKNIDRNEGIHPMWWKSYSRLQRYLKKNSIDSIYSNISTETNRLRHWIYKQKRLYRKSLLNKKQIKLLTPYINLSGKSKRTNTKSIEDVETVLLKILEFAKKGNPVYKHPNFNIFYQRRSKLNDQGTEVKNIILDINNYIKVIDTINIKNRKSWDHNYNSMINYIESKKVMIPRYIQGNYLDGEMNPLYRWFNKQKSRFEKKKMPNDKIPKFKKLLKLIEKTPTISKTKSIKSFDTRFKQLEIFINNNEFPPSRNKDGSRNKLRMFYDNQKIYYRSGKMPKERIKKFQDIGLDFNDIPSQRKLSWNESFENFRYQYKGIISLNKEIDDNVYHWFMRQKKLYQNGSLSQGQRKKLKEIGIPLDVITPFEKWYKKFNLFKNEMFDYQGNSKAYGWLHRQITAFNKNKLNIKQVEVLIEHGVELKTPMLNDRWMEYFESAKDIQEMGEERLPKMINKEPSLLYKWHLLNFVYYKLGILDKERDKLFGELKFNP